MTTTVKGVQTIQKETFHNMTNSACHPADRKCLEAEARLADETTSGSSVFTWLALLGHGSYFEQNTRTLDMNGFKQPTILDFKFTFKWKYTTSLTFM